MQEATLSNTNTCFWGKETFPLQKVVRVAIWLDFKQDFVPIGKSKYSGVLNGSILWYYLDPEGSRLGGSSITSSLAFARNLAASEPRDSVFGVLGLMSCLRNTDEIPSELSPDYRRKLVDVFRDATRAALHENEGANVYSFLQEIYHRCEKDLEDPDWLSWVPRWHRAWDYQEDAHFLSTFFSADNRTPLPPKILAREGDPNQLTLIGSKLDVVSNRSALFVRDKTYPLVRYTEWVGAAITFAQGTPGLRSDSDIANVLIAGTNSEGQPSRMTDLSSMRDSINPGFGSDADYLHPSLPPALREAQRFRGAVIDMCTNRRLFLTSKGRLGLGPQILKAGDQVVLLYGSRTPYILRQCGPDGHFKIVGEAYLEGAMYGDDYRAHKATGRPDDVFIIL